MTDDSPRSEGLILRVVYEDLPDLIQVEVRVVSGDWSGVGWGYTGPNSLAEEARDLLAWSRRPTGEFVIEAGIEAGVDMGRGWVHLRWYEVDRAGHMACHVQLVTPARNTLTESARRMTLEFPVEAYAVERFAQQLAAVVRTLTGEAVLPVPT